MYKKSGKFYEESNLKMIMQMRRELAELIPKYLLGMDRKADFYRTFRRFDFVITNVKGKHVLDIGTGHGLLLDLLGPSYSIVGIDANPKRDDVIKMDAQDLKFEENVFTTVIMAEVLEHLKDPLKGLREAYRVLKPNGRLILTTRNLWAIIYFKRAFRERRLKAYLGNILSECWNEAEANNDWHLRFRPGYLLKLIRKANFQICQFKALDFVLGRPFLRLTHILDEHFKVASLGNCVGIIGIKSARARS